VWVLADDDAEHFARFGEVRTLRVPSAFSAPDVAVAKRYDVALIGTWTWHLTRRGLEWFLDRVCPLLPGTLEVDVAGRGGEWVARAGAPVRYCGFVPDAQEFLSSARVVAVPSLGGTGVQVKTLDAIASGSRVVATAAGVRGLGALPGSVRVAHSAEEFASQLTEAAQSPESLEPSREALGWTRTRRERFVADVGAAVEAAAHGS
jgi:glycosyltransferase involved in cell wall biosynthesis